MMDQIALVQPRSGLRKVAKVVGLTLVGTSVAALLVGWVAFLLWLIAEIVMAVVHWL